MNVGWEVCNDFDCRHVDTLWQRDFERVTKLYSLAHVFESPQDPFVGVRIIGEGRWIDVPFREQKDLLGGRELNAMP